MKKTAAWLVRYALEQLNIKFTFGIPGVHNTEIYDELNNSESIQPILVTHEGYGAFMADAVSRSSDSLGTLVIVPAAGATHAASGIGEAYLDGIPMLIISGGVRTDSDYQYQLHDMNQHKMLEPITKKCFKVLKHDDVVPTLFEAFNLAHDGEPGPVFVEIPVNLQLDKGQVDKLPVFVPPQAQLGDINEALDAAVALLANAKKPGIFVGWGGVDATTYTEQIADQLTAPVSTTLQGLSAFVATHPLHTGMSFGPAAVPAATNAFDGCDCMLAIGTRFAEIATGSFGVTVPENLIHIDINPKVFNANYPAKVTLQGDAKLVLAALADKLAKANIVAKDEAKIKAAIAADKQAYLNEWFNHDSKDRVNPALFFQSLRQQIQDDAFVITDDGNHTFLTAELMPCYQPRHFFSPTDFNCMGYATPAMIGAKLANRDKQVIGIIGDGAFLMSQSELFTASHLNIGAVFTLFSDGELAQIAQAQNTPYNRKTCTVLPSVNVQPFVEAAGCRYILLDSNTNITEKIAEALALADKNIPVVLDVKVDYSKKTRFTQGIVKTNIQRMNMPTKVRMISRALWRHAKG